MLPKIGLRGGSAGLLLLIVALVAATPARHPAPPPAHEPAAGPPFPLGDLLPREVRDGSAQPVGPYTASGPLHLLFMLPPRDVEGL